LASLLVVILINDNFEREPFSYKRNTLQLDNFINGCLLFLIKNSAFKYDEAQIIINKAIEKDLLEYKKNDKREFLRSIRKKFTIFKILQKFFYKKKINIFLDNKLVHLDNINVAKDQIAYLRNILER
jgi:hypothetical protein